MKDRFVTRELNIGSLKVGGNSPIRIQSMTNTKTNDVLKTVEQILRLENAGCEIARVAVQNMKEVLSLEKIKSELLKRGSMIPLVADIQFFPKAALEVVNFVDKVRINPGNYYWTSHESWDFSLEEEIFSELVLKCKKLKKSLRIGVNHGSLSKRILKKYGNTLEGMIFSAIEYAEVCRKNDFHDLFFSMKSSNPKIMIEAYRRLLLEMILRNWNYPLHLGVTEAGAFDEGRIKSASGIGALLLDGIGDTIRFSLTEDPVNEIEPAKRLIELISNNKNSSFADTFSFLKEKKEKRKINFNLFKIPSVGLRINQKDLCNIPQIENPPSVDFVIGRDVSKNEFKKIYFIDEKEIVSLEKSKNNPIVLVTDEKDWKKLKQNPQLIIFKAKENFLPDLRKFRAFLTQNKIYSPVILNVFYKTNSQDTLLLASAEIGAILVDDLVQGILIEGSFDLQFIKTLSFNLLQSFRQRMTKTEIISCPGCGRTNYDIQKVLKEVIEKLSHYPGLKIAVMGCSVNGPGEMMDADFGCVGGKKDHVNLYIKNKCIEKDVLEDLVVTRLIELVENNNFKPLL